jgi:hypothetical protein
MIVKSNRGSIERAKPALVAVGVVVVLVALVNWGGTTRPGPLFALGVGVLLGLIGVFAGLGWWLLSSPLPSGTRATPIPGASRVRALAAAVAASSGLLFVAGGLWDEIWHRQYGGFGNDFLWPPHLLLYGSIALIAALAAGAVLVIGLRGAGGLRQRVRSEPLLGVIALVSAYLIFSLPSDELWHRIYGRDITAWSLPHVILVTGIAGVMLMSVPLALSGVPRRVRRFLDRLHPGEVIALVLVAWAATIFLQIGTAEWEGLRVVQSGSSDAFRNAFWQRPEWLYPVVILSIALFCGRVIQTATGRIGAATVVGLLVLGFRVGLMAVNHATDVGLGWTPHVLILPALFALDASAWILKARDRSGLIGNLASVTVFLAVALPALPSLVVYPRVNAGTLPGMIVMGVLMGALSGAAGSSLGRVISGLGTRAEPSLREPRLERREGLTALAGLCVAVVIVLVSFTVASPPTR